MGGACHVARFPAACKKTGLITVRKRRAMSAGQEVQEVVRVCPGSFMLWERLRPLVEELGKNLVSERLKLGYREGKKHELARGFFSR